MFCIVHGNAAHTADGNYGANNRISELGFPEWLLGGGNSTGLIKLESYLSSPPRDLGQNPYASTSELFNDWGGRGFDESVPKAAPSGGRTT